MNWAARTPRRQYGVTMVELIVTIVITGIVFAVVAIFLKRPVDAYLDTARRAALSDIADTALRRFTRDLRLALPNSVRLSGSRLEFLLTSGGGRYRAAQTSGGAGNILDLNSAGGDSSFDVIGPLPPMVAGDQIVIFNLGTGFAGADAYQPAGSNRATFAGAAGSTVSLAAPKLFPFESPGKRFHVVQHAVTYECAPVVGGAGGRLLRYANYGINAAIAPTGTPSALATDVSACSFYYEPNALSQRWGIVSIRLAITQAGETVSLFGQAHVANGP